MDNKFEVVISGISGKFPDCNNVTEFRKKLYDGKSLMSKKEDRWPTNYRYKYTDDTIPGAIGAVKFIKECDPVPFKMNRATAECTDLNRAILEPSFEAIMDAGINPYDLDEKNIAVYMSSAQTDTDSNAAASTGEGRLWVLGASKTMMANRVSFALNLKGPSYTYSNDIFGSLATFDEAYKNISEGYIDAAIVGVVSAVLHPYMSLQLTKLNYLSMDSLTRAFDKNANGYGRSDSAVVFFLQRSEDAKRIYATIDFTGSTYYGSNPNSLLAYEEDLVKSSLMDLYRQKNYNGIDDISFMEMTACGLKKLDKIEANSIADLLSDKRLNPLLVGSVKSNMGNAESAAPFVSLIKAILALDSGKIAQNINLENINDEIRAFTRNKLQVVTQPVALSGDKVAVNSVGIGGAVSQIVLKQNPRTSIPGGSVSDDLPRLILICGRTEDGTIQAIRRIEHTTYNTDFISLVNDVFCSDMPFHIYRGYSIVSSNKKYLTKNAMDVKGNAKRPIWFLFSGMGSQWNGMGNGLLDVPIIAETVKKCYDILKPKGIDIYHILTSNNPTIYDNIVHAFVGIITIQIALVEVLKALGIKPDGIIGHSVGENACAYADGCLTLEQAVLASYARGIASIETETIKGMMAAIGKGYNQIKDSLPENIEVACHNSSTSCTLSGPAEDVNKFVQQLQDEKVFARAVNVANIAYHSKYIAPAAPNLLARLGTIIPTPIERSSKWISTSIPETEWNTPLSKTCSAEYLTNNLLNHVLFEEGCKHIPSDALIIEIAPHGLLQAIVKRSLPDTCANVALTRRNNEGKNLENLLTAIGQLYIAGCSVNVNALYPPIEYPVPRETPSIAPLAVWNSTCPDAGIFTFDMVGSHSSHPITIRVNEDSPYYYLKDHKINDQIILPTSLFLYVTWWVYSVDQNIKLGSQPIVFEDITLFKNISISLYKPRSFTFFIQKGSGKFEILKCSKTDQYKTTKVMTGVLYQPMDALIYSQSEQSIGNDTFTITGEQFYKIFQDVGYHLGNTFYNLEDLTYNENDYYGKIKWNENWVTFLDSLLKFSMFDDMKNENDLLYSKYIRKLEISSADITSLETGTTLLCHKDRRTNIITCDGLKIHEVKNEHFNVAKSTNLNYKLESFHFMSHKNPRCQNIPSFVKLCLQIAVDNVAIMVKKNSAKLNIIEDSNAFQPVKQIVKSCPVLKQKVLFCYQKEVLSNQISQTDNCFLIITNNVEDVRKYETEFLFCLLITPNNASITVDINQFVTITKRCFLENTFYLLKKIPCKGSSPPVILEDNKWVNKSTSEANQSEPKFKVKTDINSTDLSLLCSNKKKSSDQRYLFIMDEEIPNDSSIENQLIQDLPVALIQNGEWGSYRTVSEQLSSCDKNGEPSYSTDVQLKSIQCQYLSSDKEVEHYDNNKYCKYGIEYSGVHDSGKRIMGLALVDTFEPITKPDSHLIWTVPKDWSLEEAVTVPSIYVQAYNILKIEISHRHYTDTALINIGQQGLLAKACVSLLLNENYSIYVTVANEQEAILIQKKFPQINSSHIFDQQNQNFEIEIMKQTKGNGVNLVINCLPDIESINSSLSSLAEFGHCAHIGNINESEISKIGMFNFIKSTSFFAVSDKISTILHLSADSKRKLKMYVEEGIKTGLVQPFERNVQIQGMPENVPKSVEQNYIKTIHKCFPDKDACYIASQTIRFDDSRSYIIIGEKKDSVWFEFMEWLISKGARKFIIAVDNFTVGPKISHQMNRLLKEKKVTIILTSSQKIASLQETEQLIDEANRTAPLEAVFFVSMESAGNKIRNIDIATQRSNLNTYLISIFSGGLKECESRRYKGFPALVIHGEKSSRKLSLVLPLVDTLLQNFDNSNSSTLYYITENDANENKIHSPSIRDYIPSDIRVLEWIGSDLYNSTEFVEVTTLSPRFSYVKEITPIFVLSALGPKPLQGLFSNLTYPTFCATPTNGRASIKDTASKLYQSLNHVQSKGGVTLLAETWCSTVAFEILYLLERDDRKYKLFTLEGNPLTWKEHAKTLGPIDSVCFENNLIAQVFNIDSKIRTEGLFKSGASLLEKLYAHLSKSAPQDLNFIHLTKVIDVIRNGLVLASKYQSKNELVKNTISLVQHFTEQETMNYSVSSEIFVHDEENYYKFISNKKISQKINDNVFYNIWYNKE